MAKSQKPEPKIDQMKIVYCEIGSIKPYPNNPRKNEKATKKVAASILEFGFNQPIVVDQDDIIIVGHTRYDAALLLGMETVPVYKINCTPEQASTYRIADNRLGEIAEWDFEKLEIEIGSIEKAGLAIELTGFTIEQYEKSKKEFLKLGKTDAETIPEKPDKAKTKAGDIWVLGNHRLM